MKPSKVQKKSENVILHLLFCTVLLSLPHSTNGKDVTCQVFQHTEFSMLQFITWGKERGTCDNKSHTTTITAAATTTTN
jgi:hypothetical protein